MQHDACTTSIVNTILFAGMWAPGIVGVVIGVLLLVVVKDRPEDIGYPPVEIVKEKKVQLLDEWLAAPWALTTLMLAVPLL